MCCRYYIGEDRTDEKMAALMDLMERQYPGAYKTGEVFPGDTAPAVIANRDRIIPVPAVFGFPGYGSGKLLLNARSETAAQKPLFSGSLKQRRVILPAAGFYEWDAEKTKFYFTADAFPVLYMCGLYSIFEGQCRFVILTRGANESMRPTHGRMPVIIGPDEVRPYLTDFSAAADIIASASPVLSRRAA